MTPSTWRTTEGGYEASGAGLTTWVRLKSPPFLEFRGAGAGGFSLSSLEYVSAGQPTAHATHPAAVGAHIQQPNLVVPHRIDSEVGLRLQVQVHAQSDGWIADFCLETIAPLDRVLLQVSGTFENAAPDWNRNLAISDPGTNKRRLAVVPMEVNSQVAGALIADLGENGRLDVAPLSPMATFSMFDQPLEKGVILVGRLGIVKRQPDQPIEALRDHCAEWLRRPTFL